MTDEYLRTIVREKLAKASPRPNHSTLYQHAQSLIRNAAHYSVRELQILHENAGINSSSSSTVEEEPRNSTSSSGSPIYNNNNNSNSSSTS